MHPTTAEFLARDHLRDVQPDPRQRLLQQRDDGSGDRARPTGVGAPSILDRARHVGTLARLAGRISLSLTGHR